MARGNSSQDIYLDNKDRIKFLYWLKDTLETHNLICHAYCLMDNHYHLLIETPDANLSSAMRDLNGNYSQWFNVKHKHIGHLFQGRYKAFVIEKEAYLLEVARYIVLNPVRAGSVEHPSQWKWSSYNATSGSRKIPEWLHVDWLLESFAQERKTAQQEYRRFIVEGIDGKDPFENLENGFLLGTPQFIHWIWENHTAGSERLKEHPREQRIVGRPTLEEIFKDIQTKEKRNSAITFARIRCGYLATEIAPFVNLDPAVVGRISKGTYNIKSP